MSSLRFGFFYWDPRPELFIMPFTHWPILWYGVLFALGFILGLPIFVGVLQRFFLQRPDFEEREIIGEVRHPFLEEAGKRGKGALVKQLNLWMASSEQAIEDGLPKKLSRLAMYSFHAQQALRRLKLERLFPNALMSLNRQAVWIADSLVVYMVIATVLGARLGHFLFYENPSEYLSNPLELLQIWKGGLASHGAAIGIVLALWLFAFWYRASLRGLTLLHLLDFVCIPTALAGAFIRIGNFFNQEILGKPSDLPWAVMFGHPADHSIPMPRHPVQLYEAIFYAITFFVLWNLSFRPKYLLEKGKLLGLFLILVFGFRFIVEYWKEEQSQIMPFSCDLTMGQILSIPAVLIGIVLLCRGCISKFQK